MAQTSAPIAAIMGARQASGIAVMIERYMAAGAD
jgi:hypothetical protein